MATKPKPGAKRTTVPPTGKRGGKAAPKKKKEYKTFMTPPFVISYPWVFEARENDDGTEKFSACGIFNPSTFGELAKRIAKDPAAKTAEWKEQWNAIRAEFKRLAVEDFDCAPETWLADLNEKGLRPGLRSGKARAGQVGYGDGTWFFNMNSSDQPDVIDKRREPISAEEGNTKEIYPGAICRATISIFSFDNKGKGIAVGLKNIQKLADGPRIDNRTKAKDDFTDEDSDFLDDDGEDGEADDFDSGDDAGDEDDFS